MDIKALQQLFNRGGFTQGYYTSFAGREMMSIERPKSWGLKVGNVDKYLTIYKKFPAMVWKFGRSQSRTGGQMFPSTPRRAR